jgi:hypothetical protein
MLRGLAFGVGSGVISAVSTYVRYYRESPFAYRRGNPMVLAAACLASLIVLGILFGVFRPVVRKIPVAATILFVSGFPVVVALDATRNTPQHPLGLVRWLPDVAYTIVAAVAGAYFYRRISADRS